MRTVPVYTPDADYIDRQLETELAAAHAQPVRRPDRTAPNTGSAQPGPPPAA